MKRFVISVILLFSIIVTTVVVFFEIKTSIEKVYDAVIVCEKSSNNELWISAKGLFEIAEKKHKILQAFLKEDYVDDFYDVIASMENAYNEKNRKDFLLLCTKAKDEISELFMYERPTIQNIL